MAQAGVTRGRWRRLAPLAALALLAAGLAFAFGDALSFEALAANRAALEGWRDANYALAVAAFLAIYAVATAVALPGAVWLTLAGGFLFGTVAAAALVVAAATAGATALFLATRTGLGDALRGRAGGFLDRMAAGLRENEAGYLLAMRLAPVVPFFVANLAPALLGARLSTFVWTTFVGIIPGAAVYASVGAGLGAVIDRGEMPDLGAIFAWPVLGPLLGLAALALLPAALKALRRPRAETR
jgi:uncharacterized membrane protein YdjX (TVP38/TMEM64 family)